MRVQVGVFAFSILFLSIASCSSEPGPAGNALASGGSVGSGGASFSGSAGTGGAAMTCGAGLLSCGAACVQTQSDFQNCGACGVKCAEGQLCSEGKCQCAAGLGLCGTTCTNLASDGANCGSCGMACSSGLFCTQGKCAAGCGAGEMACGNSCAVLGSDPTNCGFCGNRCPGGQACSNGACSCAGGRTTCSGVCTDTQSDPLNCGGCGKACATGQACSAGACQGGGGTGGSGGGGSAGAGGSGGTVLPGRNGCAAKPGLISDFEEGAAVGVVVAQEDRSGSWTKFNDGSSMSQTVAVEASGGTADCDKFALHTKGTGYGTWGAGISVNLGGTPESPAAYNATAHQFTGIRFKAKLGSTADPHSPVRFNISTSWTESKDNAGGQCTPVASTKEKAARDCYQHPGKFLNPGSGEADLTQSWKTFSYCFDRDLYPLSLPSNMTAEQRNNVGSNILKIQFQFNQGKDYSVPYTTTWPGFGKELPFDFWVDDVTFFNGDCPTTPSPSNGNPTKPFPQNANIGSCAPATNAAKFSSAIARAYATWTKTFVQNDRIVAPEPPKTVTSEAMGYGMMIAAAMGDKAAFDKFHGYVKSKGGSGTGLMTWMDGQNGSASDADIDIAYALYMADKQWPSGGYKGAADAMAQAILSQDIVSNVVRGGSSFKDAPFNASYFIPAAFRVFGSSFSAALSENYRLVTANVTGNTSGIPTDWANPSSGAPSGSGNAQVTSAITDGDNGAMGYDSARVPWRLGLDACLGGSDKAALKAMVDFFAAKYDGGASIDLMKAGWYKKDGQVHPKAIDLQASYIGPMSVGGMAMGNTVMRDAGFRALLDILESGDFNHTYFPSTVGLLTLLILSGNFPTP